MSETVHTPSQSMPEKEENKKRRWLWLLLLLLLAAGVFLALYLNGFFDSREDGIVIGAGVKKGSLSGADEGEPGSNGEDEFSIELNGYPTFADGNSEGNLNIVNPITNTLSIVVEITLADTGEVVYQSGEIPPEHYIDNDRLTKVLEKGEYEAKASVTPFDREDPERAFNRANFDLVLIIEN